AIRPARRGRPHLRPDRESPCGARLRGLCPRVDRPGVLDARGLVPFGHLRTLVRAPRRRLVLRAGHRHSGARPRVGHHPPLRLTSPLNEEAPPGGGASSNERGARRRLAQDLVRRNLGGVADDGPHQGEAIVAAEVLVLQRQLLDGAELDDLGGLVLLVHCESFSLPGEAGWVGTRDTPAGLHARPSRSRWQSTSASRCLGIDHLSKGLQPSMWPIARPTACPYGSGWYSTSSKAAPRSSSAIVSSTKWCAKFGTRAS